jgi:ergothioneine biosynthesis protein EgtB
MELATQQLDASFAELFSAVRESSAALCATLTPEDCNLQAMPETSPAKWHLAHTTWFFDTFVLGEYSVDYFPVNPLYAVLFNSYYNGIGEQFPRAQRALLSRPTLAEVLDYRATINAAVIELLNDTDHPQRELIHARVELGMHHEAQHQDLLLADVKYNLFQNPLFPVYRDQAMAAGPSDTVAPLRFINCEGGELETGYAGEAFCFDNEQPRHIEYVAPFKLADRLVTSGEYLAFVTDDGYRNPDYWLADGWNEVQQHNWQQPLYWGNIDGEWFEYTLNGLQPLDESAPVSHLSYFEAQAYAAWAGKRLPTEAEWESAAQQQSVTGNLLDTNRLQPQAASNAVGAIGQLFGDCWEWTQSAYLPYPGYQAPPGAVGEYNGKFMSGQMVLRGGSCLSQAFHIRSSYRNFFYPRDRWQCSGIRLAADI